LSSFCCHAVLEVGPMVEGDKRVGMNLELFKLFLIDKNSMLM